MSESTPFSNTDLYQGKYTLPLKLKHLQYNIDAAVSSEKHENTKFSKRADRIIDLIVSANADVVSLEELRKLPNTITPQKFLDSFEVHGYSYIVSPRNASDLAFNQAILFKNKFLFCSEFKVKWLSDTPDVPSDNWTHPSGTTGYGSIVLAAKFFFKADSKFLPLEPIWIFNTHFTLNEEVKTKSCHMLNKIIADVAGELKFICSGDFNFFPDQQEKEQEAILESFMTDVSRGAVTLGGKPVVGTFIGHEQDAFKADLNNMISRLDRVYVNSNMGAEYVSVLYTKTMLPYETVEDELTHRNYPSDHLPILTTFSLFSF